MEGLKIIATGYYPGEKVVTNEDLEKIIDTSDEWITTRTGIKRRHLSEHTSAYLAIEAAKRTVSSIDVTRIGLIICATMTPENATPSNACLVQEALGLNDQSIMCFDINAACSGFVYSLNIAKALLSSSNQYGLIIGCEQLSRIVDFQDRSTCILFGDGAGAVVVEPSSSLFISYNDASGTKLPLRASHQKDDPYLHMQGQDVFKFATKVIVKSIDYVLEKAHLTIDDIDYVLLTHDHTDHNKNIHIFDKEMVYTAKGNIADLDEDHELIPYTSYTFGDIEVYVLRVSHDATNPIGFIFSSDETLLYMTDTGYVSQKNKELIHNLNYYIIESNHDIGMLMATRRPFSLKNRIMGDTGHLNNEYSAHLMCDLIGENTKEIVLAHLSQDANTKEKALETYYSIFDEEKMTFDKEMIKAASQTSVVSGGKYEY